MKNSTPIEKLSQQYIIISIQPKWANLIFKGKKTVELRRSFSQKVKPGAIALIYVSAPISAIIGTAEIAFIETTSPHLLWEKYEKFTKTTHSEFFAYFEGRSLGTALTFKTPQRMTCKLGLKDLRQSHTFTPPVSWRFLKENELDLITYQ